MKSKNTGTTDLRVFMARAAAKKRQPEPNSVTPSSNESQMQLVVFQGQSDSGTQTVPTEPERAPSTDAPVIEEEDDETRAQDESDSSDDDIYDIEPDPGLRTPISSYDVNDQDSVRRAYIALGRCHPKMRKKDFRQHDCGGKRRFQPQWFDEYKWLEYSVDKDAAYCFVAICSKIVLNFPVEIILLMKG